IVIGRDYKSLDKLVEKQRSLTEAFEKALALYLKQTKEGKNPERPQHRTGLFGLYGKKVDSFDYYSSELDSTEREIYTIKSTPDDMFKATNCAFVTFSSPAAAASAAAKFRHIIGKSALSLSIAVTAKPCPGFEDIIFENAGLHPLVNKSRSLIAIALLVALTLGWVAIGAAVVGVGNMIQFKDQNGQPSSNAALVFLQSIIAPLLLAILTILLPIILRMISTFQGVASKSGVERSTLYKFFSFMFYQLLVTIGASVVQQYLKSFVTGDSSQHLESVLRQLSIAFSNLSTFYITFLVLSYAGYSIGLLQIGPLLITWFTKKYLVATPRDAAQMKICPNLDYLASYGPLTAFL
ncbi:hypothetical protein HDU91_003881, partial [Kappamyces sp. JEL0680]